MKSNRIRWCALSLALGFALVLDGRLIASRAVFAQERPPQANQPAHEPSEDANQGPKQAATFAGTVVKNGEHYDLRDSSGETFRLDDAARARPFTGKTVKVTGELNAQSKVIHVESIVSVEG
ncbi:MAG TPA: DUF5818 domain-containing protein [Terracidiphilus sp.]|nr:DUF5818 domain-containing protein [Terracidiphilus sp.]